MLSGTATAGTSSTITMPAGAATTTGYYAGCIVKTGGGDTGGANNQARLITSYVGSTRVATIELGWETTPDATTTVEVLYTDVAVRTVGRTPRLTCRCGCC